MGAALRVAVPHRLGGLDALKGGEEIVNLQGDDNRQEGENTFHPLHNVAAAEGGRVKAQVGEGGGEVIPGEVPAAPGNDGPQHHRHHAGGDFLKALVRLAQVVDNHHAEGQQRVEGLVKHHGDAHKGEPHQRRGGHVAHQGAVGHHLDDPPADEAPQHLDEAADEGGRQPHLESQFRVAGLPVDRAHNKVQPARQLGGPYAKGLGGHVLAVFFFGQGPGLVKIPQVPGENGQAHTGHNLPQHNVCRHAEHKEHNPSGGKDFGKTVEEDAYRGVHVALSPPAVLEFHASHSTLRFFVYSGRRAARASLV